MSEFKSTIYDQSIMNEKYAREYQIALEGMKIIKERLAHCSRTEGVNQFENCKELQKQYFALCKNLHRHFIIFINI